MPQKKKTKAEKEAAKQAQDARSNACRKFKVILIIYMRFGPCHSPAQPEPMWPQFSACLSFEPRD